MKADCQPDHPIPVALLAALTGLFFLNIVSRLMLGPLFPILEREFGFRHGTAGSLYFFVAVGYCAGLYASAYVASWFTHRATIALSSITLGIALLAVSWSPSLSGVRAGVMLLGAGTGLYLPSGIAALTENTRDAYWGRVLAVHELGPNFGYICAPLITELLLGFFSWRGVLATMGILAILLGALFQQSGLGGSSRGQPPRRATLTLLVRTRALWGMGGLFALGTGVSIGLYTMLPLFLINAAGLERSSANLITGLTRVSGLISIFVAGTLADRVGRSRTVAVALAAAGTCMVLLGLLHGPWVTPVLIFFQAGTSAAFYPAAFSMLSAVFPPPLRNVAVSMVMILGVFVGVGGVPPVIGFLADHYSFSLAFAVAGVATLASVWLLKFSSQLSLWSSAKR